MDMINSFHPGPAAYSEITGMGHDFGLYSSQTDFLDRRKSFTPHPFDDKVLAVVFGWLEQHLQS